MDQNFKRQTGTYKVLGNIHYFIPNPLPPSDPPFVINEDIMSLYGRASFALGQLNEVSLRLPDSKRFIKSYIIKEALLSSAIENIHTTLMEVLTYSFGDSRPNKDTQLVLNYTEALDEAIKMIQQENFPLVPRIILKAHALLLSSGESDKLYEYFQ